MELKKIGTTALILIILAGTWIRFHHIGRDGFRGDEIQTGYFIRTDIVNIVKNSGFERSNPPLYWILLYGWARIFGYGDATLRIPSALYSILAVWLIFLTGRRLFNHLTGLIAAFFSAGSVFHLYYAQDARNYSLLLLLSLASLWAFLLVLQNGRGWTFVVYGTAAVLCACSHSYGLFTIGAQSFFFLLYWKKHRLLRRRYLLTMTAVGAACIPLIWTLKQKTALIMEKGFWIARPDLETIVQVFSGYSGSVLNRTWPLILFSACFLIGVIPSMKPKSGPGEIQAERSLTTVRPKLFSETNHNIVLSVLCLSFPIMIPFLLSQFMTPIFFSRYTIGASALFYLLAARGVSRLKPKPLLIAVLAVFSVVSFQGLKDYAATPHKEQWREAAALIAENIQPDDAVLFYPEGTKKFIDYYHPVHVPTDFLPRNANEKHTARVLNRIAPENGRLWLVMRRPKTSMIPDYLIARLGKESVEMKTILWGVTIYRFRMNRENPDDG